MGFLFGRHFKMDTRSTARNDNILADKSFESGGLNSCVVLSWIDPADAVYAVAARKRLPEGSGVLITELNRSSCN